jgi:hypothetical protein
MRASVALVAPLLGGCIAVLDVDASRGGSGGATAEVSATASTASNASSGSGASTTASAGGSMPCHGGAAVFSGDEAMTIDNPMHNALDADDKIAVGAWIRPDPIESNDSDVEETLYSRLSDGDKKGYGLFLRRSEDGRLYPEFRFYADGHPYSCNAMLSVEPGVWSHVAAMFFQGHVAGADAAIWVDGQDACSVECGGSKLSRYPARPVLGASLSFDSFFRGAMDDFYAMSSGALPPPELSNASCSPGLIFYLPFSSPQSQTFAPKCNATGIEVTLGTDPGPDSHDPSFEDCP